MGEMGITDASTIRGCILPMSHIVGPVVCNELAEKGYTLVIFDQINPITLLEGIQKYRVNVFESVPIVFQLLLGVKNLASYDTSSMKIAAMMGTSIPVRSEEHTSELQSLMRISYAVFCLKNKHTE